MPDLISIGECMIELFSEDSIEEAETFTRSLAGDSFNPAKAMSPLPDARSSHVSFGRGAPA